MTMLACLLQPESFIFLISLLTIGSSLETGGWETLEPTKYSGLVGPCNLEVYNYEHLDQENFLKRFAYAEPVIIKVPSEMNQQFRQHSTRSAILENFGSEEVKLATANTYSYRKIHIQLADYLNNILSDQQTDPSDGTVTKMGNETGYLFGDIDHRVWHPLLKHYRQPPYSVPGLIGGLSFGIAGPATGVPFHFHGPGFGEVIYGRKRWFLYPPDDEPVFDPDNSTLQWYTDQYPNLPRDRRPLECTIGPGELIYFPDRWWHSTLNVETSVFMSTFLGPP